MNKFNVLIPNIHEVIKILILIIILMQIFKQKLDKVFDKMIVLANRRERCIKPYLFFSHNDNIVRHGDKWIPKIEY